MTCTGINNLFKLKMFPLQTLTCTEHCVKAQTISLRNRCTFSPHDLTPSKSIASFSVLLFEHSTSRVMKNVLKMKEDLYSGGIRLAWFSSLFTHHEACFLRKEAYPCILTSRSVKSKIHSQLRRTTILQMPRPSHQ